MHQPYYMRGIGPIITKDTKDTLDTLDTKAIVTMGRRATGHVVMISALM